MSLPFFVLLVSTKTCFGYCITNFGNKCIFQLLYFNQSELRKWILVSHQNIQATRNYVIIANKTFTPHLIISSVGIVFINFKTPPPPLMTAKSVLFSNTDNKNGKCGVS